MLSRDPAVAAHCLAMKAVKVAGLGRAISQNYHLGWLCEGQEGPRQAEHCPEKVSGRKQSSQGLQANGWGGG